MLGSFPGGEEYLFIQTSPEPRSGRVSLRFLPFVPSVWGLGFLFFQCPLFCSLPFSLVVLQRLTPLVLQIPLVYWLPCRPISERIGLGEGFPVILVNVWGPLRVVLDFFLSFY